MLLLLATIRMPFVWPLVFISFVPALSLAHRGRNYLVSTFLYGALIGTVSAAVSVYWIMDVFPLPPSYGSPVLQYALVFGSWVFTAVVTGVWLGFWLAGISYMGRTGIRATIFAVLGFLVAGYMGMLAYALLTAAPNVSNPIFFSSYLIGYVLADSPFFLQFASVGGVWTLTALAISINVIIFNALYAPRVQRIRQLVGVGFVLLVTGLLLVASLRAQAKADSRTPITVGFISAGLTVHDTPAASARDFYSKRIQEGLLPEQLDTVDLLVLPEGVSFPTLALSTISSSSALIMSAPYGTDEGRVALAGYLVHNGVRTWARNKWALAPMGEYAPYVFSAAAKATGRKNGIAAYAGTNSLTNGSLGNVAVHGPARIAILFCSELLFPGLGKKLVTEQRANILVFASSRASFNNSYALEQDTLRYARVQTVEAGVPSITSTTNGSAYVLDRFGRVLSRINAERGQVLIGRATLQLLNSK